MTEDKKTKVTALRKQLAGLTETERREFLNRGIVATVEGHPLSPANTIFCYLQRQGTTIVGGYRQWQRANRQVQAGEHGMTIWFPAGKKNGDDETEEISFYLTTVFDVSQTKAND